MNIEQIYTGCLSQGAYYITSNGEAAIIDPLREVGPYLERLANDNVKLKYIFETHFHADFVSGHVNLSDKTQAPIVFGPNANTKFEAIIATDGQSFKVGDITLTALHTPGHTMESTTYLLKDEKGKDHAIFTGDTLFLGDVGRPDLAQKAGNMTQEELAALLFKSLREKIMPLSDDVIVYPAHGAGSACGKNLSSETVDYLGNQKLTNYALRADMSEAEFVKELTSGLLPPPAYFPLNVKLNQEGYKKVDDVMNAGLTPLGPGQFETLANSPDVLMLDVRTKEEFKAGHIPNSIFIGLDGSFAPWVGALIKDIHQKIVLIAPSGQEEEAITRLSRVGFDNVLGYLEGGLDAWKNTNMDVDTIEMISAQELENEIDNKPILDVRKPGEYNTSHLKSATNLPLDFINEHLAQVPQGKPFFLHCQSGYRSVIAASILKSRGYHDFKDVTGGFLAFQENGLPLVSATLDQASE